MGAIRVIGAGVCLALCAATPVAASPWGQPFGAVFSCHRLDVYRARQDDRRFDQQSVSLYAETGLPRRWTLGGKVSWGDQTLEGPGYADSRRGVMEGEMFLSRRIDDGAGRAALSLDVHHSAGTNIASDITGLAADGQDAASGIGLGAGTSVGPAFVAGKVRHMWSSGDDADRLDADVTLGRAVRQGDVLMLLELNTTTATGGASGPGRSHDLGTLAASAAMRVGRGMRLQAGLSQDVWSRNTDRGTHAFLTLWVQR